MSFSERTGVRISAGQFASSQARVLLRNASGSIVINEAISGVDAIVEPTALSATRPRPSARGWRPAMEDLMDKPTTSPISTRKHGDVLIILSNNPPVNALSTPVRQGLVDAIAEAEGDDSVHAVVIACEGQTFFAGADITEFGKPPVMPWLPTVVDAIENCSKPVAAAIPGPALGGGLEVALACHYRVAVPSAKLGTPEVKLGLLPGAGGTQRLPRVAGVRQALEMCATGNPIGAKAGFACGLGDRAVEGELVPRAGGYVWRVSEVRP